MIRQNTDALFDREVDVAGLQSEAQLVLPESLRREAGQTITRWNGYAPTPLHDLASLAAELGIARLQCKDEASRFGLGSFKALGGAFAVEMEARGNPGATIACATEGNHGRSVAWGAQRCGLRCIVFLHEGVSRSREAAIAAYGAEIRRVRGSYDDAVRICAGEAESNKWIVVSDTSWPGYDRIPRVVMAGYTVMTQEIRQALRDGQPPTHVLLQGGVGGLAAAAIADLSEVYSPVATRYVIVEPIGAACLLKSLANGRPVPAPGPFNTIMAGLACGEVSELAFPIVKAGAWAALAITDEAVIRAMRLLAARTDGDAEVVAGASGAAGLAGLLVALEDRVACRALSLDSASRVLIINTEGATDPELYRRQIAAG